MNADDQRDLDELEREFRRVGVSWDAFAELCRLNAPNEPISADGSFSMQLNYSKTTAFSGPFRTVPDRLHSLELGTRSLASHLGEGSKPQCKHRSGSAPIGAAATQVATGA